MSEVVTPNIEYAARHDATDEIVGVGWTDNRSSAESDVAAWIADGHPTTLVQRYVGDPVPVRHSLTITEVEAMLADHEPTFVQITEGEKHGIWAPVIARCPRCPGEFYGTTQAEALRRHDVKRISQHFAMVRDYFPNQLADMFAEDSRGD